jgi:hypothetical protein
LDRKRSNPEVQMQSPIRAAGAWLTAAGAAVGLAAALTDYLRRGSGIDHTAGALLVIVSTLLLLAVGLVLASRWPRGGLRIVLLVLAILDVLGTGVAAVFLHAWALLVLMVVALVGWGFLAGACRPALQESVS